MEQQEDWRFPNWLKKLFPSAGYSGTAQKYAEGPSNGFGDKNVAQNDRTVFVVDDEPVIAQTLAVILNNVGFCARAFDHPQKAMEAAKLAAPQLLISDVVMPGMTGIELGVHFRSTYPDCKILLFSGQASTADLLETARKEGHDFDLLTKPVHPADLLAKLRG